MRLEGRWKEEIQDEVAERRHVGSEALLMISVVILRAGGSH